APEPPRGTYLPVLRGQRPCLLVTATRLVGEVIAVRADPPRHSAEPVHLLACPALRASHTAAPAHAPGMFLGQGTFLRGFQPIPPFFESNDPNELAHLAFPRLAIIAEEDDDPNELSNDLPIWLATGFPDQDLNAAEGGTGVVGMDGRHNPSGSGVECRE